MAKAKQPVSVDGIEFDALITESASYEAEVPEYPIESGFMVNDTIILRPILLDMTLFLTDTPVTWKARFGNQSNRVQSVIKKLEDLYFSRKLVTVKTSEKTYANMAITSITFSKSREVGYAREIPIKFKQVRVTSSGTTSIPASYGKSGASGTKAGTANTSNGNTGSGGSDSSSGSGSSGSVLYGLANKAGLLP